MSAPVLVAGGGIAGCAAALGLHRAGVPVEVLEARDDADGRGGGWFLTVAPSGVRALRALGAGDALDAVSRPLSDLVVCDAHGAGTGVRRLLGGGDPVGHRLVGRADLAAALRAEVRDRGVRLHDRTRVTGVGEIAGGVVVQAGGGRRTAPLLVGADGVGSLVRGHVDPACPPPRPVGQRVFYGRTSARPFDDAGTFQVVASAAQAFVALPTAEGATWWFSRTGPPCPDGAPEDDPHATLAAVLGPEGAAAGLLADTDPADVGAVDPHDLPRLERWWRGRTVLVGDAAHAASPATGQGATLACEDAVVLAKALRTADLGDAAAVAEALDRYRTLRRGRCLANVVASAERSGSPVPDVAAAEPLPDEVLRTHLDWDAALPDP